MAALPLFVEQRRDDWKHEQLRNIGADVKRMGVGLGGDTGQSRCSAQGEGWICRFGGAPRMAKLQLLDLAWPGSTATEDARERFSKSAGAQNEGAE